MSNQFILKFFAFLFLPAITSFLCCSLSPKADLIIYNGKIYTMDANQPIAEMVAIKGGKIIHVGSSDELDRWRGSQTKIINLEGKTMTPGLIESHGHIMGMGYAKMKLDLSQVKKYQELVKIVEAAVKKARPGEWILGRGWHQSKWNPSPSLMVRGFQTHHLLSQVSPDNPVYLTHASGHAGFANAKAMEIAGISRSTLFQGDGEIIKDEQGNPTGIFIEEATSLITQHIPESTPEKDRQALELAIQECFKNGITTFRDAGAGEKEIQLYKEFLKNNKLKVRLWVMLDGSDAELLQKWFEKGPEIGLGNHFLTIRAIKLYADGALGSRGAWLLEPYSDRPGHYGQAVTPMEKIYQVARQGLQYGFQVCVHAIGDRANREVLNQFERVFKELPEKANDHRFRIEHAQHISARDIPRFAQLGVIASMQGIHLSSDRPWAIHRLGKKRIEEGAYAWQKLLQSGAIIVNGTDVPVEPINPIACFYASVTRKTLDGYPPNGYEPDQKMTREQALRSYTLDAAYGAFEENLKGSIEVGKFADFTVFSQDIMTVPEDKLLETRIVYTIINGEIVYQAPEAN